MKIKPKNNKILIFIILLIFIFLLVILGIITNYKNIGFIYNAFGKNLKNEDEGEIISVDIKVKEIQEI